MNAHRGSVLNARMSYGLLAASGALLVMGVGLWLSSLSEAAGVVWTVSSTLGIAAAAVWLVQALQRRRLGVDVIALLALAGALWVGEPFAGAMITLMLATGRVLDSRAEARARRDLSLLVERAPRVARRLRGEASEVIAVVDVVVGDQLLVAGGEVVPVDGRAMERVTIDESALTGEPIPVEHLPGDEVRSGTVNASGPFRMLAVAGASDSTYARIVRLAEQAQASTAPFVRLADRLAVIFVPVTLLLAGMAWLVSGDPERPVAVLVVATPCPLLLAAPIAIVGGLGRAARHGVVIKGGAALEGLAAGRVLLLDKTGTITRGRPELRSVSSDDGSADELLRLAASVEQVSPHLVADAIVAAARDRDLALTLPDSSHEEHGLGVEGVVEGHAVWVGRDPDQHEAEEGMLAVRVVVDGTRVGHLELADPVRPGAAALVSDLRAVGLERVVLVTGDREGPARAIGAAVGVDDVVWDCDPEGKAKVVANESRHGPTVMVGDGINDAPALSAADVGVALAARGTTVSGEVADVVITVDSMEALVDAVRIARRSRSIARQAASVGMGLSGLAMAAAAAGVLGPAGGAVLQEGIDLVAIAIALRGVRGA